MSLLCLGAYACVKAHLSEARQSQDTVLFVIRAHLRSHWSIKLDLRVEAFLVTVWMKSLTVTKYYA